LGCSAAKANPYDAITYDLQQLARVGVLFISSHVNSSLVIGLYAHFEAEWHAEAQRELKDGLDVG
jgi:hypothetical protein